MSEDSSYRVYVDGRPVDVPRPATVIDALETADPSAAAGVRSGERAVMDSRGLPIAPDAPLSGGAILRVVAVRRRES